jgi:hypothetical protein
MSWYADLGTATMVATGDHVRAIGWLASDRIYPRGDVPAEDLAQLRQFVRLASASAEALDFPAFAGFHTCELCGEVNDGRNFGVPAGGLLYVAPGMVAHYVAHHGYSPPAEFLTALADSPLPDTSEYRSLAEPFARLHRAEWDRRLQRQIDHAGRWALERGGTDEAVWQAVRTFCGMWTNEMFERVRGAMQAAEPGIAPARSEPNQ